MLLWCVRFGRRASTVLVCLALLGCRRLPDTRLPPFQAAFSYDLTTLDPHAEANVSSELLFNVYEPLVAMDADLEVRPALAQSWTTPDELTWHLRLRPSVRFHSGRRLEAADVVYTLERIRSHPELEAGYYLIDVVGVHALDDQTVELKTRQASPILLHRLSFVPIVPATGTELARTADGTGPFRVVSWSKGERLELRRHDGYWGKVGPIHDVTFWFGRTQAQSPRGSWMGSTNSPRWGPGRPIPASPSRLA